MNRIERWEQQTEWALTAAAIVFLIAYALPIAWPTVNPTIASACSLVVWMTWALFAVDYFIRLLLTDDHGDFVKHNLLDLAVVILPIIRPLRLLRLVALLSVLNRTGSRGLRGRVVAYAAGGTVLLLVVGALAVTDAERGKLGSSIHGLGDGFWWAITTITTVGYGDIFPVTTTGRIIAAALMVGGIAVLGVVTATLASWLVERVGDVTEQQETATRAEVAQLTVQVQALTEQLARAYRLNDPAHADANHHARPPISG